MTMSTSPNLNPQVAASLSRLFLRGEPPRNLVKDPRKEPDA